MVPQNWVQYPVRRAGTRTQPLRRIGLSGDHAELIGGAFDARKLDAKRAIKQATELAVGHERRACVTTSSKGRPRWFIRRVVRPRQLQICDL